MSDASKLVRVAFVGDIPAIASADFLTGGSAAHSREFSPTGVARWSGKITKTPRPPKSAEAEIKPVKVVDVEVMLVGEWESLPSDFKPDWVVAETRWPTDFCEILVQVPGYTHRKANLSFDPGATKVIAIGGTKPSTPRRAAQLLTAIITDIQGALPIANHRGPATGRRTNGPYHFKPSGG